MQEEPFAGSINKFQKDLMKIQFYPRADGLIKKFIARKNISEVSPHPTSSFAFASFKNSLAKKNSLIFCFYHTSKNKAAKP